MRIAGSALILIACIAADLHSATYYVDSRNGNDNFPGSGTGSQAWKTIDKVNSMIFGSDTLLFACGGIWNGSLDIKGTGAPGRPFLVSKYGTGAMPIINGNGAAFAVRLRNQEYFILSNLEVTNIATPSTTARQGVHIQYSGFGKTVHDIVVRDMYVHDVDGSISGPAWYFQNSAGIRFNRESSSPYDNCLVENNRIERIHGQGIYFQGTGTNSKHARFRNNYMQTIGGDGIDIHSCDTAIAEYNTLCGAGWVIDGCCAGIWSIYGGNGVTIQFNEVYGFTDNDCDGEPWDSDWQERNQINQYNYSHDCNGGVILVMNDASGPTVRYNISYNDGSHTGNLIDMRSPDPCFVYNNVFYNPGDFSPRYYDASAGDKPQLTNNTFNNIFVKINTPIVGSNNCFFGSQSGTPGNGNIVGDPKFAAAIKADTGFSGLGRYKLTAGSPCIGAGKYMAGMGVRDFFGNPLPTNGPIDIGVHQITKPTSGVYAVVSADVISGDVPMTVAFTGSNSVGANLTYAWNFGDPTSSSNTSAGANPSHVYQKEGTYTAKLTVSNGTLSGIDSLPIFVRSDSWRILRLVSTGKTAVASSMSGNLVAANAVDGNAWTRWASNAANNEWIYVDLGQSMHVSKIDLLWEAAYGSQYKIQISGDAQTWTDLYTETAGNGGTDGIMVDGTGRYVRMLGVMPATGWGYSLYSFDIYATSGDTPTGRAAYVPGHSRAINAPVVTLSKGTLAAILPQSRAYHIELFSAIGKCVAAEHGVGAQCRMPVVPRGQAVSLVRISQGKSVWTRMIAQ